MKREMLKAQPGVVLSDFVTVKPSPPIPQDLANDVLALMIAKARCIDQNISDQEEVDAELKRARARVVKYGVSSEYIKQRYMVLAATDSILKMKIGQKLAEKGAFLQLAARSPLFDQAILNHQNPQGLDLDGRMKLYEKFASKIIKALYDGAETPPDDIVHVTCSGYLSPSPVERLVSEKGWLRTSITHSYHMGCYGSIPALRMAHGFLSSARMGVTPPKGRVDIVHTEILSAHTKIVDDTPEQIITMTLFGDGFVKYSAFPEDVFLGCGKPGLKLLAIKEHLIPDSLDDMTWRLGPHNFDMTLALSVPYKIRDVVRPYVSEIFAEIGLDFDHEKQRGNVVYAIHPGGPLIVKKIAEQLDLVEADLELSRAVLYENGNMSSATIPYVLNQIISDDSIPSGTLVLSLAFGPGLTIAGMILQKV